ncbi:MAG: hypothetical protein AB1726_05410 [Planctomycetota bacterium]
MAAAHLVAGLDLEGRRGNAADAIPGAGGATVAAVVPLCAAAGAGIAVDPAVLDALARRLDEMTDPASGVAEWPRATPPAAGEQRLAPYRDSDLTGGVLLARIFLGQNPTSHPVLRAHAGHLARHLPARDPGDAELYLRRLHDATYAMSRMGGQHSAEWNDAMKKALLPAQVRTGREKGTWDPRGPAGRAGGRVLATALAARTLEVYSRTTPLPAGR